MGLGAVCRQAYPPSMRVSETRVWLVLVLLLFVGVGCASSKGKEVGPDRRVVQGAEDPDKQWPKWFPHAVDLRVHPASRYVLEREVLRLEARIELLDQFNEPTKDVGRLGVELRLLDQQGQIVRDEQGQQRGFRWWFDLTTQQSQSDHWDPIARAYVLPLKIGEADTDLPKYRSVLVATFEPAWPGLPTLPKDQPTRQPVEIRTDW